MATFEDFLSEGKKLQIKRKYTENHPAKTVGKTANVRNAVLQAIADGVVTREEFNKILSELSADSRQWSSRNRKYFNVSEEGIKLSKWGRRILAELDETPKAAEVNEKIKVTKDKFPYIEFKDGGKKYEVEFDQGDIIDDHGNEGKDWYYVGVDQHGDEWEMDVYTDYRDEPEDWFYDTIKRADESVVTENYEVIWSDGMKGLKKFPNERKARAFFDDKIKQKGMRDVALYRAGSGFHSTTQTEYVIAFWGDGSYLDNVSKKDADLAKKKVTENKDMKNEINLFESFSDFVGANFLNERLGSQIMAQIFMSNRQGSYAKKELSNLAKGFYNMSKVALDKIQDEDFIVSADPSKVFKNYGGANHILFFISDNEKENPYAPRDAYSSEKVVPGGGILLAAMSGDRMFYTNHWSRWSGGASWSKDKKGSDDQIGINHKYKGWDATGLSNGKRISEVSDRVIVLNLDLVRQKYSTQQLRDARAEAKAGATAFKSDKEFKDANKKRYHDILATKAASLPLDKMVEEAIDKLAKQISDGLKKGEKTQYNEIKIGESPKGREVKAKDASAHMSSILDAYSRYCDYIKQAEESEKRYGERESYYERESKNYAKEIKNKIKKIDTYDYAW